MCKMSIMKIFLFLLLGAMTVDSLVINCLFYGPMQFMDDAEYICRVTSLSNQEIETVEKVTGDHSSGKSLIDVEGIRFYGFEYDLSLSSVPSNLNEFFPNLIDIGIHETGLKTLTINDLSHFPNLQKFSCGNNPIVSIPANFFQENLKLEFVQFYGSQVLRHIGENLLGSLAKLNWAYFDNNYCISRIAITIANVQELNKNLHIYCPEVEQCPSSCSERSDNLEKRVEELERLVREITVRP